MVPSVAFPFSLTSHIPQSHTATSYSNFVQPRIPSHYETVANNYILHNVDEEKDDPTLYPHYHTLGT